MKKTILMVIITILATSLFAKDNGALKFLGIPIDGPEEQFKSALMNKGFTKNYLLDCLDGMFNGRSVHVATVNNHGKVCRVFVSFPETTEEAIKEEYNELLRQLNASDKYVSDVFNVEIPEVEDISYEMIAHKKPYLAAYYYYDPKRYSPESVKEMVDALGGVLPEAEVDDLRKQLDVAFAAKRSKREALFSELQENIQKALEKIEEPNAEDVFNLYVKLSEISRKRADGIVWLTIYREGSDYCINLSYDNMRNQEYSDDL